MNLTKNNSSQLTLSFVIVLLTGLVATVPTGGQSCTPLDGTVPAWPRNSTVYVDLGNLNTQQRRQVAAAINSWNQANQSNGSYVSFSFNPPPTSTSFRLNFQIGQTIPPSPTSSAPAAQINTSGGIDGQGNLNRATITFDTSVQAPDQNGNLVQQLDEAASSDAFLKAALHEIGHSMGFADGQIDPTHPTSGPCAQYGQISGSTVMNGMCGANDWGGNMPTTVTPCDNQRVPIINQYQCTLSISACSPRSFDAPSCVCYDPPPGSGGFGCPATECNEASGSQIDYCLYSDGCPSGWINTGQCCQPWNITPIVIDVDGSGFNLTDAKHGVPFDFFGIKKSFQLSWTTQNSTNAFLVLDRDGNGTIDSGRELFGNMTPQPKSSDANGFLALAEYDEAANGGNGDRMIDHKDAIYVSLRLWQDNNHNGVSEATELHSLSAGNVATIEVDYKLSKKTDEHGNQFRYRAKVKNGKGEQAGRWAWDVILVSP